MEIPIRDTQKPARLTISNFYQSNGKLKGFSVSGKIESGQILTKGKYVIMPHGIVCSVKGIFFFIVNSKIIYFFNK